MDAMRVWEEMQGQLGNVTPQEDSSTPSEQGQRQRLPHRSHKGVLDLTNTASTC